MTSWPARPASGGSGTSEPGPGWRICRFSAPTVRWRSASAPSSTASASTSSGPKISSKISAERRRSTDWIAACASTSAPRLLIIDEFGVWPYDRLAATAFFSLVSARYERGSIL